MPSVKIPPDALTRLKIFGYQKVGEDAVHIFYESQDSYVVVRKDDPWIWFEDINDAIQLGAEAIIVGVPEQ